MFTTLSRYLCKSGLLIEHYCFVAYAAAETFNLGHYVIWNISCALFVTGIIAVCIEHKKGRLHV